jgi:hypothetical protein
VLLVAHFVSVLCVVLHVTILRGFRKIWIHMSYEFICNMNSYLIWIHMQNKNSLHLWQITWMVLRDIFFASFFLHTIIWYGNQNFFFAFAHSRWS